MMKRIFALFFTAMLILSLAACAERAASTGAGGDTSATSGGPQSEEAVGLAAQSREDAAVSPSAEEPRPSGNPDAAQVDAQSFAGDAETQEYVCELASLFGGESFASPAQIDPLLLARTCAVKLYSLGEANEGDDGWCTIPQDTLGGYLSSRFGIDIEDCIPAATAPSLEYLRNTREFRFYPAGEGGRYGAAIDDIQIEGDTVVYEITLTDGFEPALQKEILLSFSMEQKDGGGFYLRLQANQVQQAVEPTAAALLKNGLERIREAEETGRIEIAVDISFPSEPTEALSSRTPTWDDVIVQIDNARKIGYSYRPTVDMVLHENALYRKFSSAVEWGEPNQKKSYAEAKRAFFELSGSFLPQLGDEELSQFVLTADTDTHITLCAPVYLPALCYPIALYFDSDGEGVSQPYTEVVIQRDSGKIEEIFMRFYARNPDQGVGIKDETPVYQMGRYRYRYDDFELRAEKFLQQQ